MAKIYETTTGLVVDVPIVDGRDLPVDLDNVSSTMLKVLPPGSSDEETWQVTIEAPNILRHVVPEGYQLIPGTYRIQPYIAMVTGFAGPWGVVHLKIEQRMRR